MSSACSVWTCRTGHDRGPTGALQGPYRGLHTAQTQTKALVPPLPHTGVDLLVASHNTQPRSTQPSTVSDWSNPQTADALSDFACSTGPDTVCAVRKASNTAEHIGQICSQTRPGRGLKGPQAANNNNNNNNSSTERRRETPALNAWRETVRIQSPARYPRPSRTLCVTAIGTAAVWECSASRPAPSPSRCLRPSPDVSLLHRLTSSPGNAIATCNRLASACKVGSQFQTCFPPSLNRRNVFPVGCWARL